jgi:geranylgeranyl diphosphate synthase type II
MEPMPRIERTLTEALARRTALDCPPILAEAVHYAVIPGGGRIRPRLCCAVAEACGNDAPRATDAAAAAIELLHCASLVHDDLPCFDDAETRRGKPSVHVAYGERVAVLTGDALIALAFEILGQAAEQAPARLPTLLRTLGVAAGLEGGICAGQAWECEDPAKVDLTRYEQAKTGALFAAATAMGAAAAGIEPTPWRTLGARLGQAYQVADDIRDVAADPEQLGKPIGRDVALDRPSYVRAYGLDGAKQELKSLIAQAMDSIPDCPGQADLKTLIRAESKRFLPKELALHAA